MKTLALCLALACASAGCLGTFVPDPQPGGVKDMAGGGGAGGGGGGNVGGNGTSTDMAFTASTDLAGVTPGTKVFGDLCTIPGDCQSTLCEQFVMGTVHRCSQACTVATQTADCPAPSAGTCTPNGYCKFNN